MARCSLHQPESGRLEFLEGQEIDTDALDRIERNPPLIRSKAGGDMDGFYTEFFLGRVTLGVHWGYMGE
jgi:hypothetical protein